MAVEFDVVVVGGGPAGSTTAGLLAQRGHRVLVLERERFPRYHIGESLITGMLSVFDELGVRDRLEKVGFPRKNGLSIIWGKNRDLWNVNFSEIDGPYDYSFHVRRAEFDEILLDHARGLGVTVIEEATVKEPILEAGRVTGVRYEAGGETTEARAPLVIDASGQARVLSRKLTSIEWAEDMRNLAYWTYFEDTTDLPKDQLGNILVERVTHGWFWAIPVDDATKRLSVGYVTPTESLVPGGPSIGELYDAGVAESKQLKRLLVGAKQAEDFQSTRDWSYRSEAVTGPGWLSTGDASGFIDPLFSGGVCLAVLGADAAAKAADTVLRRPDLADRAIAAYSAGVDNMVSSFLDYVRFFYDPTRDREDYFEQARSMSDFNERYPNAREAFVAVISGRLAMSELFRIPGVEEPAPAGTVES